MTQRIEVLQAGRAVAAVSVAACHAQLYAPTFSLLDHRLGGIFWGVHFFFLLSGFIIYRVYARRSFDLRDYAVSRAARIYVPYLPIGIIAALAYAALGREFSWASSLLLVPGEAALAVAWTLQHEMMFYLLAGLFFLSGRPLVAAAVWATLIIIRNSWFEPLPGPEQGLFGSPEQVMFGLVNLHFVAGMFLAACVRLPDIKIGPALNLLGDASYAIYLVHLPLMGLLWRFGAGFWTLLLTGILAGIAYHLWFEAPALRWVRSRPPWREPRRLVI